MKEYKITGCKPDAVRYPTAFWRWQGGEKAYNKLLIMPK